MPESLLSGFEPETYALRVAGSWAEEVRRYPSPQVSSLFREAFGLQRTAVDKIRIRVD